MKPLYTPLELELAKFDTKLPCECYVCGKSFQKAKRDIMKVIRNRPGVNGKYCSHQCAKSRTHDQTKIVSCNNCGKEVIRRNSQLSESGNQFCSHSCSATYNNPLKPPKIKADIKLHCIVCDKILIKSQRKFCSNFCSSSFRSKVAQDIPNPSARSLKKKLLVTRGHRCEICHLSVWMGKPIPIELDHKNGNSENNENTNLRLICPNCHAQTPTYKAKNTGQGRHSRRKRYADGKSY